MIITAADAYKRTVNSVTDGSEYAEDHTDIILDIEDACNAGLYECDFIDSDYADMEKHMDDLKNSGFDVVNENGSYIVSWKNAR